MFELTKMQKESRGFPTKPCNSCHKKMGNFILHEPKGKYPAIDKTMKRARVYVKSSKIFLKNIALQAKISI